MRKLAAAIASLLAAAWSLLVWGGYALLAWAGDFAARHAGTLGLPGEAMEALAWAQRLLDSFGQGAATVLWLVGLGLIALGLLIVGGLAARLAPARPIGTERGDMAAVPAVQPGSKPAPSWGREASPR